jgi:hypothetical protein
MYLYLACLAGSIGALVSLAITAASALRPLMDTCATVNSAPFVPSPDATCPADPNWLVTSQGAWIALVFIVIWAFHFRIAARDRAAVGESGASATLRRWYMYVVLLAGLLVMLTGTWATPRACSSAGSSYGASTGATSRSTTSRTTDIQRFAR